MVLAEVVLSLVDILSDPLVVIQLAVVGGGVEQISGGAGELGLVVLLRLVAEVGLGGFGDDLGAVEEIGFGGLPVVIGVVGVLRNGLLLITLG